MGHKYDALLERLKFLYDCPNFRFRAILLLFFEGLFLALFLLYFDATLLWIKKNSLKMISWFNHVPVNHWRNFNSNVMIMTGLEDLHKIFGRFSSGLRKRLAQNTWPILYKLSYVMYFKDFTLFYRKSC